MVRFMADATSLSSLPHGALTVPGHGSVTVELCAGYINGSWPTATRGHVDVSIDVAGTVPSANVLDVEIGDATPDTVPDWIARHRAASATRPVIYCNRSTRPAVAAACAGAGLAPGRDFWWWIATLDGTQTLPDMTGVVAVQAWSAAYFPQNIDVSVVYDDGWPLEGDLANSDEILALVKECQERLRGSDPNLDMLQRILMAADHTSDILTRGHTGDTGDNKDRLDDIWGLLVAIKSGEGVVVDPAAVAAAIAKALPPNIAQEVVDLLAARMQKPPPPPVVKS